jgi:hypothetical protein
VPALLDLPGPAHPPCTTTGPPSACRTAPATSVPLLLPRFPFPNLNRARRLLSSPCPCPGFLAPHLTTSSPIPLLLLPPPSSPSSSSATLPSSYTLESLATDQGKRGPPPRHSPVALRNSHLLPDTRAASSTRRRRHLEPHRVSSLIAQSTPGQTMGRA